MAGVTPVARDQQAAPGMIVQDRETALRQAVSQGQWQEAVALVQLGVSSSQRDAVLLRAAESEQWDCVSDVLHLGVSRPARDDMLLRTIHHRRWDCAGKIIDLGVSPKKRDLVFSDVVAHGDARLSSQLITAGLSPAVRDCVVRDAMERGCLSFVLELLRLTAPTPSVSAFVLDTAVSLQDWTLVFEVVKLHEVLQLSTQQMDAVCRAAVSGQQWDCAFFLLEHGAHPTQETVDAVLHSAWELDLLERFVGIYPPEAMSSAVKTMLLGGAISLGRVDNLQDLLRCYGASEKETEECFERAVSCRNQEALQILLSRANINSQILKRLCATKSDVYTSETFTWICWALEHRNIVLSLDIALTSGNIDVFETVLIHNDRQVGWKVRCMFMKKACALSEVLFGMVAENLVVKHPRYCRTLFLMSVRQGRPYEALELLGESPGVSLRDVKYALSVAVACLGPSKEEIVQSFIEKLDMVDSSVSSKLLKVMVRDSLDHFEATGEEEAEFLTWYKLYCDRERQTLAATSFGLSVFRRVYTAAVTWDRVQCFVDSIGYVQEFKANMRTSWAHGYTSKAILAIDFALKKQKYTFVSLTFCASDRDELDIPVLKNVFREGAWQVFDVLFGSKDPTVAARMCKYGQVFLHCLIRTVFNFKASGVPTVRASSIETVGTPDTATAIVEVSDTVNVAASGSETVGSSGSETVAASGSTTVGSSDSEIVWASGSGAVGVLDKWLHCMCSIAILHSQEPAGCRLTRSLGSHNLYNSGLSEQSDTDTVLRLAEFSSGHACPFLALFLAAAHGAGGRGLMERVAASHLHSVGLNPLFELACYTFNTLKEPRGAAVLVKNIPLSALWLWSGTYVGYELGRLCPTDRVRSQELIAALRQENAPRWVLVCRLVAGDFDEAEKSLALCDSQECVDVALDYAARSSRWDLVYGYVSEACRPDLLQQLLHVGMGCYQETDEVVVRHLVSLAGTCHHGSRLAERPYLSDVTRRVLPYRRLRALLLARCLVSLGASASQRRAESADNRDCPLRSALACGALQLVKLFHRSGVCSNRRLFQLAPDSPREPRGVVQAAIQSYLTFAASCPLSLQDLCRNTVSSCLGSRPGYWKRVQALPVPEPVKEFVLFADLVQEE